MSQISKMSSTSKSKSTFPVMICSQTRHHSKPVIHWSLLALNQKKLSSSVTKILDERDAEDEDKSDTGYYLFRFRVLYYSPSQTAKNSVPLTPPISRRISLHLKRLWIWMVSFSLYSLNFSLETRNNKYGQFQVVEKFRRDCEYFKMCIPLA